MNAALSNAQRQQVVPAAAERSSTSARGRDVRTPHRSTPISRLVHVRQGNSVSVLSPAAPPATADHRQAAYFVRLLSASRQQIDQRLDSYQRAIAVSEASGDAENVRSFRRLARIEEQDRQTVRDLIENLQRRFPVGAPSEVPHIPRRTRPAG